MKKTFSLITALALSLTAASAARIYTPEETGAESKRANEFLDKCYDDFIAHHPQAAARLGIKTNYDKWDDISDAQAAADLAVELANVAALTRDFDLTAPGHCLQDWNVKDLELREKAKKELGNKFDIRQFHEVVLTNGAIPLDVLQELVDRWVKSKQGG